MDVAREMTRYLIFSLAALSVVAGWYFWPHEFGEPWLQINFRPDEVAASPSIFHGPPLKVIQFNVDHGGESRRAAVLSWLLQQNADVVGFCEANKWQHNLSGIAASAGYEHAEIFPTEHGYPLAVFSKTPIEVVGRHEIHFERGVLHVQILGIHFFIAHLNAHNSTAREEETKYLGTLVRRVTLPVVVMGDMNTLSPLDDKELQSMVTENQPLLQALSSLHCYRAMRRKFLQGPEFNKRFNYKPMMNLLEAGLVDASSARMTTEPTNIPCDQANYCDCPHLRLDYMLISTQLAAMDLPPTAHVVIDDQTKILSDHFPIELKTYQGPRF